MKTSGPRWSPWRTGVDGTKPGGVHEAEVDAADAVAGEDVQFWSALLVLRAEVPTHVAVRVLLLGGIHFETLHAAGRARRHRLAMHRRRALGVLLCANQLL